MAELDIREWAVKGAEQRLVELAIEARVIFAAFPELRKPGRGFESNGHGAAAPAASTRTRSSNMSAAARRKVSLAQKKRWAEWRRKKAKASA